ncbi:MAG: protein kinase [Planctomycetes bacterium]|uniref:protein kinase domain-containing protein n=1 Tax=Candidatus Wunengus sp. YC65 TaxID=3367701 RepID=UPI001D2CA76F|nr:protein kinase [Planctomycetota bacterium]
MFSFTDTKKLDKLYQEGDWNGIIEIAERHFKDDIINVKVLNDLAVAYKKIGRDRDAFLVCQKIYENYPITDILKESVNTGIRYMRYHLVMGELLYLRGEYEEALHILNQLKLIGSHFSDKFYILAKIYIKKGLVDKALDEYRNLFHLCPHRHTTALKGFVEIIELDPLNESAYKSLYEAYKKKGVLDKAIAEYEATSRLNDNFMNKYILGHLYYYAGRIKDSIAYFNKFLTLPPNDTNIQFFLAYIYSENNEVERAVGIFQDLIIKDPSKLRVAISHLEKLLMHKLDEKQTPCLLNALCEFCAQVMATDIPLAENVLAKIIKLKPNDGIYQTKLETLLDRAAEQYIKGGQVDMAYERLQKLIHLRPDNLNYAKRYKDAHKIIIEPKIKNLEKILSNINLPEAEANRIQYELATLYEEKEDEKALSLLQTVERVPSEYQLDAQFRLGKFFFKKGTRNIAEEYFNKVIEAAMPMDKKVDSLYQIGVAFEEHDIPEKALDIYKKIISFDIGYKDIAKRLEIITQRLKMKETMSASELVLEDRYEDIQLIGQGSIGVVYRAVDKILKRKVALKVIKDDYKNNKEAIERFIREAQSVSLFKHPGFITIYDINVNKQFFIVMDYIEGEDLQLLMKKGALPMKDAVQIAINICDALSCAHQNGVVHRDIKPGNILVMKDLRIKISDFGLTQLMTPSVIGQPGQVLGEPVYLSPEQIRGETLDYRSDIYSFGIILYEMLTGKTPFNEGDIAYRHINEEPQPPATLNSKIPRWLENIVLKCIRKKPEDRYQQTDHLLKEIKSYSKFILDS